MPATTRIPLTPLEMLSRWDRYFANYPDVAETPNLKWLVERTRQTLKAHGMPLAEPHPGLSGERLRVDQITQDPFGALAEQEALRERAPHLHCAACKRVEYDTTMQGKLCGMMEPSGATCMGALLL